MVNMMTTKLTDKSQINPFSAMASIYLFTAIFTSLGSFLSILNLYTINGISWMRIHFITLGVTLQFLMGFLPKQVAKDQEVGTRWDIFVILNTGILVFLYGRYYQDHAFLLTGGIILFIATLLFYIQLITIKSSGPAFESGKLFYLTGLTYFFLGILMGTGIWLNWGVELQVKNILEVHIHANNWGLITFVFAGLFIDNYEKWYHRSLKWPQSIKYVYVLLVIGTFGLVLGPWTGSLLLIVPGLLAHLIGSVLLLLNLYLPLKTKSEKSLLQAISAYIWFFAPVFVSPLVLLRLPGIPGMTIEARAPEALIFGWVLPIILFFYLTLSKSNTAEPHALSSETAILFHIGAISLWIGIFTVDLFYGLAYLFWMVAVITVLFDHLKAKA